jgi:hypothetical protein
MPSPRSLEDFKDRLLGLEGLGEWPVLRQWGRLVGLISARRSLPSDAPILTILLGPTGVGKSTLLNQVVGRAVSPPGPVRPCTTHPVVVASTRAADLLRTDLLLTGAFAGAEVVTGGAVEEVIGPQALVDTPDFDSVSEENRRSAELLLHRADRVVLVLSPEKYADSTVWEVLETLRRIGSVTGCVFNKAEGEAALEDCARLLREIGLPAPLAIPRVSRPDDPLPPELLSPLRALVAPPANPGALLAERRAALERWESELRCESVAPWLASVHRTLDHVESELARHSAELLQRIRDRFPLELDEALSRELQERFLEKIQKYDFLREPRRWLGTPFRWLASVLSPGSTQPRDRDKYPVADWLTEMNRDRYLEFLSGVVDDLRTLALEAEGSMHPRVSWPEVREPPPQEAIRGLEAVFQGLQEQIEGEAARISESLSWAGKVGFYGSQAMFNVLTFAVLVKTGGGLSFGDLAAQGLLSPYLAKLSAHLVSTGEVAAVERRLEEALGRALEGEVRPLAGPLGQRAEELRAVAGRPSEWGDAVLRWESRAR